MKNAAIIALVYPIACIGAGICWAALFLAVLIEACKRPASGRAQSGASGAN